MEITIAGTPTEVLAAMDTLDLCLDVREQTAPEPAGEGLVRVVAVVLDPQDPANWPSDDEMADALGISLAQVQAMSRPDGGQAR